MSGYVREEVFMAHFFRVELPKPEPASDRAPPKEPAPAVKSNAIASAPTEGFVPREGRGDLAQFGARSNPSIPVRPRGTPGPEHPEAEVYWHFQAQLLSMSVAPNKDGGASVVVKGAAVAFTTDRSRDA